MTTIILIFLGVVMFIVLATLVVMFAIATPRLRQGMGKTKKNLWLDGWKRADDLSQEHDQ